ncbi:MAG: alkaline phosphatase family protein [Gammaproteobacteria bacterium]|nr:alkaline phosphatase family protein [Gammaproteobacteria bacterium]
MGLQAFASQFQNYFASAQSGRDLVQLSRAVAAPSHGFARQDLTRRLDQAAKRVLFVVDGIGADLAEQWALVPSADERVRGQSIFPTATGSAVPSLLSGLYPATHGLLGWHCYVPEYQAIYAGLPWKAKRPANTDEVVPVVEPAKYYGKPPTVNRFDALVVPAEIQNSIISQIFQPQAAVLGYDQDDSFVDAVEQALHEASNQTIYVYFSDYDHLAHGFGPFSPEAKQSIDRFNRIYAALRPSMAAHRAAAVITADHGHLETQFEDWIDVESLMGEAIIGLHWGEPRMAFVRAPKTRHFAERVFEATKGRVFAATRTQLLQWQVFGPAPQHEGLIDRMGDFALLGSGAICIDDRRAHRPVQLKGMHGGASEIERDIPMLFEFFK